MIKKVILTESQFNLLVESNLIIESIFGFDSINRFNNDIKKLIKKMIIGGMSIAAITTMVNNYCSERNIPNKTKQEVLSIVNDLNKTDNFKNSDWKLVDDKTIATVYNAVPSQCNNDCQHTASMFRLNLNDVLSHRIIAMERTFMQKLGLKYGDVVKIEGTKGYDGVWQIQDTMNKRFAGQHKIDILVPNNIKHGMWNDVKIYALKDKSLTNDYRSNMASQIGKKK
ncbi:MAG: hypothetical protein IKT40_12545 [Bacilli bacterium]|nr:hypothetical protein [Bacilli bacterium]